MMQDNGESTMDPNKEKTQEMISRAMKGDQKAFTYLYDEYYKLAYTAVKEIMSDHQECEDIVQEAYMKCFAKLQEGTQIAEFATYISQTAKNTAKDHIKAREAKKRPDEVLSSFQTNDESDDEEVELVDSKHSEYQKEILDSITFYQSPEQKYEEKEVKETLNEILKELPDYQQEALSLFYLEDMKLREIAELYNVSLGTIQSRVNQGRKKVKTKVEELEKKKGIKLHGMAPLTFFFMLLRQNASAEAANLSVSGASFVAANNIGTSANNIGTSANNIGTSVNKGIAGSNKSFFAGKVTIAGKAISTKAIAIITAGVVGIGAGVGITATINKNNEDKLKQEDEMVIVEEKEEEEVDSEPKSESESEPEAESVVETESSAETESEVEPSSSESDNTPAIASDTTEYVEVNGEYQSESGDIIFISIYTSGPQAGYGGSFNINGETVYIYERGVDNVYQLSSSYEANIDSGYTLVAMSDNSLNIFKDGVFIDNYKLNYRFYS